MDYDGKLSIDGCIKYIVLGRKFFLDEGKIKKLTDLIVNPNSTCYKKFVPHSFATTSYDSHGYSTFEISFKIHETIKPKSVIRIFQCRTAVRNPLLSPRWPEKIVLFLKTWPDKEYACLLFW